MLVLRGYYYDTETELYFLKTRYYDPEIGRFISADSIEYADPEHVNGLNLYAYCNNNPIMNVDPSGCFAIALSIGISSAICYLLAAIGVIGVTAASAYIESRTHYISNAISTVFESIGNAISTAVNAVYSIIDDLHTSISNFAESLKDKIKGRYGPVREDHYIVAKRASGAERARYYLKKSNIDIDSQVNRVKVLKTIHKVMHTQLYYFILTQSIVMAYVFNGRNGVLSMLGFYKSIFGGLEVD